jgi:hypothetical protein
MGMSCISALMFERNRCLLWKALATLSAGMFALLLGAGTVAYLVLFYVVGTAGHPREFEGQIDLLLGVSFALAVCGTTLLVIGAIFLAEAKVVGRRQRREQHEDK